MVQNNTDQAKGFQTLVEQDLDTPKKTPENSADSAIGAIIIAALLLLLIL